MEYLVEREALLNSLHACLDAAVDGAGHTVFLAGEAGAGKTSLLQAFAAARGSTALWWGCCDAMQTPLPLAPLQDIARTVGVGFGAELTGRTGRVALFEAILADLARGPVLFVIEDAHWADAATLDMLKFVGRRIERIPCLLVVSWRSDEVGVTHPLRRLLGELQGGQSTRIDVPRLSPAGVETLAQRAMQSADGIHPVTQGNPFFVMELLRHGSAGVPSGVQDLVLARYSRLSRSAQEVVQLASVAPGKIERWIVDRLLQPGIESLDECLNCGLLLARDNALVFRHELARLAVEQALSTPVAEALHARVLAALEDHDTVWVSPARRVHHAVRAGDVSAVQYLAPLAAEEARRRSSRREAVAHLRTAIKFGGNLNSMSRAELSDQLSYDCYLMGDLDEAIDARLLSMKLWRASRNSLKAGDALRWMSRLLWCDGRTPEATHYADEAIAVLETEPPGHELAMAWSNRSQLHMLAGEGEAARSQGKKALALARAIGDKEAEIHALNNIGTAKLDAGDVGGREDVEFSLSLALSEGYEEHAALAYARLVATAVFECDLAAAEEYLDRGMAYCERRDLDCLARHIAVYRGMVWFARGEWTRAQMHIQDIVSGKRVLPITKVMALTIMGRVHARRGEAGSATECLLEAQRIAGTTGEFQCAGPVAAALAEAAWLRADSSAAAAEAAKVRLPGNPSYRKWVVSELAWWLHRTNTSAEEMPPDCVEPYRLQIAGCWRDAATLWARLGYPYEAARALSEGDAPAQIEALAIFEKLGALADVARTRKALRAAGARGVPRGRRASTRANPHGLTAKESEVYQLLCQGLRNAEIAERLHRSARTVDHHLSAVFSKLGVESRAEAISSALRVQQ